MLVHYADDTMLVGLDEYEARTALGMLVRHL